MALQDLTPQLRTRLSRTERAAGTGDEDRPCLAPSFDVVERGVEVGQHVGIDRVELLGSRQRHDGCKRGTGRRAGDVVEGELDRGHRCDPFGSVPAASRATSEATISCLRILPDAVEGNVSRISSRCGHL